MTLASLAREAVLLAAAEFDSLGRADFLRLYGFNKAKSYFLELNDRLYDSKAIVGRALGLSPADFSGGDQTVARRLEELDFRVRYFPVLPWTRGEIVLACAVVEANGWKQPSGQVGDWRIVELSELLQAPVFHPLDQHGPDFRNPAGVGRKMADIATSHPNYHGVPTKGNQLDGKVVRDFISRPAEMRAEAARLRALLLGYESVEVEAQERLSGNGDGPVVFDVPVEAHRTTTYRTGAQVDEATATRREGELVTRYREWKRASGEHVIGKVILLPGQAGRLRVDLYDVKKAELIEAKGSSKRDYIRFALGQVLDYARYIDHQRRAVLLPVHPGDDLLELLLSHHVDCIYETINGSFERVSSAVAS